MSIYVQNFKTLSTFLGWWVGTVRALQRRRPQMSVGKVEIKIPRLKYKLLRAERAQITADFRRKTISGSDLGNEKRTELINKKMKIQRTSRTMKTACGGAGAQVYPA